MTSSQSTKAPAAWHRAMTSRNLRNLIRFFPPVEVLKESDEQLVGGFNFQPISKILVKIGSFPQVGLKIKSVGNHSLDKVLISCYSHSRVRNPFRHQTSGMLPHSRVKIRQLSQASFPPLCPETQDIQHHFG